MILPVNDDYRRARFPLACALIDLFNQPGSNRACMFASYLALRANARVSRGPSGRGPVVDVLELGVV